MKKIVFLQKNGETFMQCDIFSACGGCIFRDKEYEKYCQEKFENFKKNIALISGKNVIINPPVFICDGTRRRATFAFEYKKKQLVIGFNEASSHHIVDIIKCPLLTPHLNNIIPFLRELLNAIVKEPFQIKKGKKIISQNITKGDIFICEADNGIDVVLEYDAPLELNHRMIIFEKVSINNAVVRVSHRRSPLGNTETIIEKSRPYIKIGNYDVFIPAGTFLQPSKEGQKALGDIVLKYFENIEGNIADLFCGVGTFSYLLASKDKVKITSIDSSTQLLKGFQDSINKNQITNIKIANKNLFKYPLDESELKEFDAILFDPPRAGAKALCESIAKSLSKPKILVAVSCNPNTFINDANTLISGGYELKEVTMVDQFIYSNHSELVAVFTKK